MVYYSKTVTTQQSGKVDEIIIHYAPVSIEIDVLITTEGEYRFYTGLRGDTFFGNPIGLKNNMQWTGQHYFADRNVFGIVLEVPNAALGSSPQVGEQAQIMVPVHGVCTSVNRMGRPNRLQGLLGGQHFNATHPQKQRASFLSQLTNQFHEFGYNDDEAIALAMEWLPDILPNNYASAEGYPNRLRLNDDVANHWWRLQTKSRVTSDLLGLHTDYLSDFPFLGPPHGA